MLLKFSDWLAYELFGLSPETRLGAAVNFFIYDSIKILLLLFILIFVIGVLRTFLPQEKIKQWMGKRGVAGNFYAAIFLKGTYARRSRGEAVSSLGRRP